MGLPPPKRVVVAPKLKTRVLWERTEKREKGGERRRLIWCVEVYLNMHLNIKLLVNYMNIDSKIKFCNNIKEKLTKISQPLARLPHLSQPIENPDIIQSCYQFCQF